VFSLIESLALDHSMPDLRFRHWQEKRTTRISKKALPDGWKASAFAAEAEEAKALAPLVSSRIFVVHLLSATPSLLATATVYITDAGLWEWIDGSANAYNPQYDRLAKRTYIAYEVEFLAQLHESSCWRTSLLSLAPRVWGQPSAGRSRHLSPKSLAQVLSADGSRFRSNPNGSYREAAYGVGADRPD